MNPFRKLISPRLPQAAVALSGEAASVVQLERRGGGLAVRSAGLLPLPAGLVRPSFDEQNVSDGAELAGALSELLTSAGQARRKRWSVALPEAATRTSILTMETAPASRAEAEEMLRWKTERALGAALDELRVSRERLKPDAQGRERHLVTAVRLPVLAEYEQVFASLGWHAGLVLPRHMGEAWWLMRDGGRAPFGLAARERAPRRVHGAHTARGPAALRARRLVRSGRPRRRAVPLPALLPRPQRAARRRRRRGRAAATGAGLLARPHR